MPPYSEIKLGACVIPAGDPGEQFIANLLLAIFALHADDVAVGQTHLSYALSITANLEKQAQTYRSANRMKVVGITSGTDDQRETLMLPVVGERLVFPGIDLKQIAKQIKSFKGEQPIISLQSVDIFYYDLRLRPARLRRSLASIVELDAAAQLLAQAEDLLTGCLGDRQRTADAIDLAYDYLSLTYEFSAFNNMLLAGMALQQATKTIDEFVVHNEGLNEMQSVVAFRAKVQVLSKVLKEGVS